MTTLIFGHGVDLEPIQIHDPKTVEGQKKGIQVRDGGHDYFAPYVTFADYEALLTRAVRKSAGSEVVVNLLPVQRSNRLDRKIARVPIGLKILCRNYSTPFPTPGGFRTRRDRQSSGACGRPVRDGPLPFSRSEASGK